MLNFWNKKDKNIPSPLAGEGKGEGDLLESKKLWKELDEAEEQWCCKAMKELIKQSGNPIFLSISMADKGAVTIVFKHCPSCGKKL
jgi:hypothetical protein